MQQNCTHNISYVISIHSLSHLYMFSDVITGSHLQLINTAIDTFLVSFALLGRPIMNQWKLDGAVGESSVEQQIRNSDAIVHLTCACNCYL